MKESVIFSNKKVLQAAHIPDTIAHRDEQLREVASILAPALKLDRPSNLFVYGMTGTGKTLVIRHITESMMAIAKKKKLPLNVIYINCKLKKVADTEYRLVAQLVRELGKTVPATGLPTDQIYSIFYDLVDSKEQIIILVLDEIDQLAKRAGDDILYNLTRINAEFKRAQLSLVGISNDLVFVDRLDSRVRSSLSEEEILFAPYNAPQIQDILRERARRAFKEGALKSGVLEKCAAYAAREHGDARRALELLRVAGELAERKSCRYIEIKHLDEAEQKIDRERLLDITLNQPKQFQLVLYALITLFGRRSPIITGEIYTIYEQLCHRVKLRPLTQRRVSDIIAEFDMLGVVQARVVSKGRYGRTRDITLGIPKPLIPRVKELLAKSLEISYE